MAEYIVKVADERGHLLQQVENGYSESEIRDRYVQQGYLVYWVKPRGMLAGGEVPLTGPVPDAVRAAAHKLWGDVPVFPSMQVGATDSRYLREAGILAYGVDTASQAMAACSNDTPSGTAASATNGTTTFVAHPPS